MEVGGIEPHARVVAQGLTPYCDQIVTVFSGPISTATSSLSRYDIPPGSDANTLPFFSRGECQVILDWWREVYNRQLPHRALGFKTPVEAAETY
jgi:transposase InsO family protein